MNIWEESITTIKCVSTTVWGWKVGRCINEYFGLYSKWLWLIFYILSKYVPTTNSIHTNFLDFRVDLAWQLIGNFNGRKRRGRPSISRNPSANSMHYPFKTEKRHRCDLCYKKKKIKLTQWHCNQCDKYLCHTGIPGTNCFYIEHKWL